MAEPQGQQPENRSSSTSILLITGAFMLLYYGYQHFFARTPQAPNEEGLTAEQVAERAEDIADRRAARAGQLATATIRTDLFEAEIDNLGGGLTHFRLFGDRFHEEDGSQQDLVTTEYEEYRPLRITVPGVDIPPDAVWTITQESERSVTLRWSGNGVEIRRRIQAGTAPYQLYQTTEITNVANYERRVRVEEHAYHYVLRSEESSGMFSTRSTRIGQGLCRHDDETVRKARNDLAEAHGYGGTIDFAGVENTYFVQALAAAGEGAERCGIVASDRFEAGSDTAAGTLFEAQLRYPVVTLAPGATHLTFTMLYLGPKDWNSLEAAGHDLEEVVNLGTFAIIARQFSRLLVLIHDYVGNWGLAIILLTALVRLALYPVMARQFRAFAPMRKLKPEMDKINAQFPEDMERRNAAVMELYKKHGINPAAQMLGCLPVLLQMPVFFALYTMLSTNIELYHQPFVLWWTDLSARDPFFSLPLALTVLMHVQQRMTPTQMDPAQARMMMWMMPIMMGVFMLFMPSGLALYSLTNSGLSIAQQRFNEWRWQKEEAAREAAAKTAAPAAETTTQDAPAAGETASGPSARRRPRRG